MKLYNTLTRKMDNFKPIKPNEVGVYSCGPTVYWNQHIGNMYAYIQWDVLVRLLRYLGFKVKWVMNITDVGHLTSDQDLGEDKMEKGAKREGLPVWEIAEKYLKQFLDSINLLNIQRPDVLCRATEHIKEQIDLIKKIEDNGFTYKTKTGLVFDTSKFSDYPKFANLNLKEQNAGTRVKVDLEKKHPWDFLLWVTNQPKHIMQWDSPWGRGFPGWHIECTAMSTKYLGHHFDIHTGGKEHIPVHHTNEMAQAYGAFGEKTANYWLHNDWLLVKNEKVSKSLGNFYLVTDLIKKGFNHLSFRYLSLTSHYRQGLNFTFEALQGAETALKNIYSIIADLKNQKGESEISPEKLAKIDQYRKKFLEAMNNDLNTPSALAITWEMLKSNIPSSDKYDLALEMDRILGLKLNEVLPARQPVIPEEIRNLVKKRELLRKEKKWQEADKVRIEIENKGYTVEDTTQGAKIKTEY